MTICITYWLYVYGRITFHTFRNPQHPLFKTLIRDQDTQQNSKQCSLWCVFVYFLASLWDAFFPCFSMIPLCCPSSPLVDSIGIHRTHLIDVNLFTRHRQSFPCARLKPKRPTWLQGFDDDPWKINIPGRNGSVVICWSHGDRWNIPPKKSGCWTATTPSIRYVLKGNPGS